jgi:uncharacterized membrane protein YgcG
MLDSLAPDTRHDIYWGAAIVVFSAGLSLFITIEEDAPCSFRSDPPHYHSVPRNFIGDFFHNFFNILFFILRILATFSNSGSHSSSSSRSSFGGGGGSFGGGGASAQW